MNSFSRIKKTVLLAALIAITLSGCIVVPAHRYYGGGDVVVAPPVGFVWFDGYWDHGYYGRHWVGGHWGRPHR
jgi:hypothetical protein